MLEYEKQIFLDILQEDGLVIAARGLGLESVVVNLLKVYCDPGNLVFVLGTEGQDQEWILSTLTAEGVNPLPHVVSSEMGAAEREKSYLEGGLWMVPTRILIVDMIKKRIPIDLITGFVVWKAHKILVAHQESFVLRLFRQGNKTGFIKAFSNFAPSFMHGFAKVEDVMKKLFVRRLHLWPRYHASVKSSLSECKPTVIELHLEMTSAMLQLQTSLLDLIKITVQELKRLNPTLDTDEVTVENAINKSFHKSLQSQLDPVWHALSDRTKILIADLKLLHHMIISLLTEDCVSFYALVSSQRKAERALRSSGWHLLPSAEILFNVSRQRVYGKNTGRVDVDELDPEPNPKWTILSEVLSEIHRGINSKKNERNQNECFDENIEKELEEIFDTQTVDEEKEEPEGDVGSVLVLVHDKRTCEQLRLFLTIGSKQLLAMQFRKCFLKSNTPEDEDTSNTKKSKSELEIKKDEEEPEVLEEGNYTLSLSEANLDLLVNDSIHNLAGCFEQTQLTQEEKLMESIYKSQTSQRSPNIMIQSFRKDWVSLPRILETLRPQWVIMYDSDVGVVRQLEVYQRNHPEVQLKVYFLVYGGTVEEQAYLTSLRKEKEAFDLLISEKARIVLPETYDNNMLLMRDSTKANELAVDSRKGGLEEQPKTTPRIIVDMREFRSELPALIHSRGIDIEPLTLTVGDYVLTPDICLERKSVSDLIQSLNSGRLYNQAQAMTRHYTRPMLLIEFDKDKPFDLQDRYYLSTDASSDQVVTKLQLLTLHFPQLRLIWSPSPHATAQLFEELKQGRPEPISAVAIELGVEQFATDEDKFNPAIHSFLSKLPGITTKNIYNILHKVSSLDELVKLSVEELTSKLENSLDAVKLYEGIHNTHIQSDSTSVGQGFGRSRGNNRGKRKRFH